MAEQSDSNSASNLSDYEKLLQEFEIQPDTVAKLEKLGITSLRSFSLLTPELVDSNLTDASLGQRLLLKAAIESASRLRQRQQQQDESVGKATVPSYTFDSSTHQTGTRYVVSVTTKDNQVVALPVTKETYEKCFLKGGSQSSGSDSEGDSVKEKRRHKSKGSSQHGRYQQFPERRKRSNNPQREVPHMGSQHCIEKIPVPADSSKAAPRKRCMQCLKRGVRSCTRYHCASCPGQPGLCRKEDCFTMFHWEEHQPSSSPPEGDGNSTTQKCQECGAKGTVWCPTCPGRPVFCRSSNCFTVYHRSHYGRNFPASLGEECGSQKKKPRAQHYVPIKRQPAAASQELQVFNPGEATEQASSSNHVLQRIPPREYNRHPQKRCTVCREKGIRRDSRYYCPGCVGQPGFCRLNDCFAEYHHMVFGNGVLVVQNE